jgi:hypothetical protein
MSVPGIVNPFTKSPCLLSGAADSRNITNGLQEKRLLSLADRRPHPPSLQPPVPLARKRGWQPFLVQSQVLLPPLRHPRQITSMSILHTAIPPFHLRHGGPVIGNGTW